MSRINIRAKGQNGEREVAELLENHIRSICDRMGIYVPDERLFLRNQNQSSVGGSDLTNPFNLSIEVKRQEVQAVNGWWRQCVASAERSDAVPLLIYRRSRQPWQVCMWARLGAQQVNKTETVCQVIVGLEPFYEWLTQYFMENFIHFTIEVNGVRQIKVSV